MVGFSSNLSLFDLALPVSQVAAASAAAFGLGKLGQYSASVPNTVVLSSVAALTASVANQFFSSSWAQYAAIPAGLGLGVLAQRLINKTLSFSDILDVKSALTITAALTLTKLALETFKKRNEEEKDFEEVGPLA